MLVTVRVIYSQKAKVKSAPTVIGRARRLISADAYLLFLFPLDGILGTVHFLRDRGDSWDLGEC